VAHYEATVNRGDLSVRSLTDELNDRWGKGWKLANAFEQGGNTVLIWERTQG
jgi:hypothetical protein